MASTEQESKTSRPQLVKLDRALKMAEQWVSKMNAQLDDCKTIQVELEGRPARLGIGAAIPRESKVVRSNDPVERKIRAKLDAEKRKVAKRNEEHAPLTNGRTIDEDSDDDESESKTKAFVKKRPIVTASFPQAKKKQK